MTELNVQKSQFVIEECFPYLRGSTDEWSTIWGPAPMSEIWDDFLNRFTVEVNHAFIGSQNGERLYRIRELDTGRAVLVLGPTSTVKPERVGEKHADGRRTLTQVPADAEQTLRTAATALVAEQRDALTAALQ
jgi:hypothetical protein